MVIQKILPVNLDKAPNSITTVPTPAVEVTGVSPFGTPFRKFTVPYGIPKNRWKRKKIKINPKFTMLNFQQLAQNLFNELLIKTSVN